MNSALPPPGLDHFQAEIAEVALRAIGQHGFALAGAGALVAHGVISRPTQDLDLFTPAEGGPGKASAALLTALTDAGCQVRVLEPAEQHGGEFMRLEVQRGDPSSTSTWPATGGSIRRCGCRSVRCCTSRTPSPARSPP